MQLLLKSVPLGHITHHAPETTRLAICVPDRRYRDRNISSGSVLFLLLVAKSGVGLTGSVNFIICLKNTFGVLFIHKLSIVDTQQFFSGVGKYFAHGIIDEGKIASQIDLMVAICNGLQNCSIFLFRLSKRLLSSLTLSDVSDVFDHSFTFP